MTSCFTKTTWSPGGIPKPVCRGCDASSPGQRLEPIWVLQQGIISAVSYSSHWLRRQFVSRDTWGSVSQGCEPVCCRQHEGTGQTAAFGRKMKWITVLSSRCLNNRILNESCFANLPWRTRSCHLPPCLVKNNTVNDWRYLHGHLQAIGCFGVKRTGWNDPLVYKSHQTNSY